MDEQPSDTMNLDLNLGPVPAQEGGLLSPRHSTNLDELFDEPFNRLAEAVRLRWRQHFPDENRNISVELNQLLGNNNNVDALQTGEGSVAAEERINDVSKACENNNGFSEEGASEKKDVDEKGNGNDGSFFDCNICLDLAREPVVTCCGHLFCWPCLYRWLNIHSEAKECPLCKGEVTTKNVTPIYGRGSNPRLIDDDLDLSIPSRPNARRIESWRQTIQRSGIAFPMEEMLRRISSRFEFARDLVPHQHRHTDHARETNHAREITERTNSILDSIRTSRGMRREHHPGQTPEIILDLTQGETSADRGEYRRRQPSLLRRARSSRTPELERLAESSFHIHHSGRNQEQPTPVEDRDSFSSIAAVINSEGQTLDTAVEIDSLVSISTSSSRMRNEVSRASDIDSGDSRAPRRRRLN